MAGAFDHESWERRWAQVIRERPEMVASRPPSPYLDSEVADLRPGRALDAGCGHGSEAISLAASGWTVTAVDFSATALDFGRALAEAAGSEVADRIEWVEADLGAWSPPPAAFDLVSCLYVHVAGSVVDMVSRLASGVAPGGTLLLVGHLPFDPATGEPSAAADQVQVSVAEALEVIDSAEWVVAVAEERTRGAAGSGVDAVVRAVRNL